MFSSSLLACGGASEENTLPVENLHVGNPNVEEPGKEAAHHQGHGKHDPRLGHRFENAKEWAKRFDDPKRDGWQKPSEVIALMKIEKGMRVVDIGAGTGYFLPYLSEAVGKSGHVLGLDIEADMVRYMEARATKMGLSNIQAKQVSTENPGLADHSVDRILIVNTWHHIPNRVAYAKKMVAALKPGGRIVIVDFTMESPIGPPAKHRLTSADILKELEWDMELAGLPNGTRLFLGEVIVEGLPHQYIIVGQSALIRH